MVLTVTNVRISMIRKLIGFEKGEKKQRSKINLDLRTNSQVTRQ